MSIYKNDRFVYGLQVVWIAQWLEIAQALVGILTLGYYVPSWSIRWYVYKIRKGM